MADNTVMNPGVGGDTLRTEDVGGGVKIQAGKTHTGAAGVDGGPVTISNPFPVMIVSGSDNVGTITNPLWMSGTVGLSNALVTVRSGSLIALTMGGQIVTTANPVPTSGSAGILIGGNPAAEINPVPVSGTVGLSTAAAVTVKSGSLVSLLTNGLIVTPANPIPFSGSAGLLIAGSQASAINPVPVSGSTGILVAGSQASEANPVPVSGTVGLSSAASVTVRSGSLIALTMGGQVVTALNPLSTSGSAGILIAGSPAAEANPVPVSGTVGLSVAAAVTVRSGSLIALTMGGQIVTPANQIPVSGSAGILIAGSPTSTANPVPVSGTIGLSSLGLPVSLANPLPIWPAAQAGGQILSGSTTRTVQYSFADASTSGSANQIIPPQGVNNRIRVLSMHLMVDANVVTRWQSTGSAGVINNIAGYMSIPAAGGYILPNNPNGWFQTNANEGLNLNLGAAVHVGIIITWIIAGP